MGCHVSRRALHIPPDHPMAPTFSQPTRSFSFFSCVLARHSFSSVQPDRYRTFVCSVHFSLSLSLSSLVTQHLFVTHSYLSSIQYPAHATSSATRHFNTAKKRVPLAYTQGEKKKINEKKQVSFHH